jgi:hypothetical protein
MIKKLQKKQIYIINFISSNEIYMNQKYIRFCYSKWGLYHAVKYKLHLLKLSC